MFKKSMIAMAVLSMAAGAQADVNRVTADQIDAYIKDNVVNIDAGEIYQPGADKGASKNLGFFRV